MFKSLVRLFALGMVFFLAGCQTSSVPAGFFTYTPAPRMNLEQSVKLAFMRSGDPVVSQVRVETHDKTILLSGYVKKIRQSDLAEQIARQVPGVQQVENQVIVRP